MKIVLASQSPRRKELLGRMGLEFVTQASKIDESAFDGLAARELVATLSREKAQWIARQLDGETLVIGADTVVVRDGAALGKPKDAEDAVAMLLSLSGRDHQVCTGVTVCRGDRVLTQVEETQVTFRDLTETEVRQYVSTGEPMDKAGAYGIQGLGGLLVEGIRGDYSNVVGLPVSFTLTGWDPDAQGTTYKLKAEGYKIGAGGVQLGLPSDSSTVNTQAVVAAALTIVNTAVYAPNKDKNTAGYTIITISAVTAPSRELTVAIFGLMEAERVTVTEPAIEGVTAPVVGETPVTAITKGKQFTGTVTWSPDLVDGKFGPQTVYTATITLTPKVGYKLDGVAANFFTVAGATSVSNEANSGVVTAVFPATKEAAT